MSSLDLQSRVDGATVVIALEGELDLASVGELDTEIARLAADDAAGEVVVDLRELAFMDSSGLRSIILAESRVTEAGKRFALIQGNESVHRVFEITRMTDRFTFVAPDPAAEGDAA